MQPSGWFHTQRMYVLEFLGRVTCICGKRNAGQVAGYFGASEAELVGVLGIDLELLQRMYH